jgi:hypothetical protein
MGWQVLYRLHVILDLDSIIQLSRQVYHKHYIDQTHSRCVYWVFYTRDFKLNSIAAQGRLGRAR